MSKITLSLFSALIASLCFGLIMPFVQAEDKLTQERQVVYPTDYVPLMRNHRVLGQPVVQTKINSTQSATFLLDTGSFSIFSSEMAKEVGFKTQPAFLDNGKPFLWRGKQGTMTWASSLKVGDLSLSHVPFRLLESQDFLLLPNQGLDDTRYDGIIGIDVLQHFAVSLDGGQHKIGLCYPGNLSRQQVGQLGLAQPYVVPLIHKDGLWLVNAQITNNGTTQSEDLILDTGSNFTEVSDATAQQLHLQSNEKHHAASAYNSDVVIGISNANQLRIGDLTLSNVAVDIAPTSEKQPSLLGMDILSQYKVLMDFPGKKMYLQSNTPSVNITVKPQVTPPAQR